MCNMRLCIVLGMNNSCPCEDIETCLLSVQVQASTKDLIRNVKEKQSQERKKNEKQQTFVKANPCFHCQMIALADCADSFRHLKSPKDEEQLHSVAPPEHPIFLAMWWAQPRRHSASQMLFASYWRTKTCRWYLFNFKTLTTKIDQK